MCVMQKLYFGKRYVKSEVYMPQVYVTYDIDMSVADITRIVVINIACYVLSDQIPLISHQIIAIILQIPHSVDNVHISHLKSKRVSINLQIRKLNANFIYGILNKVV